MWETMKKDPLIKTIVVLLLGVIAFGFSFNIMFGAGGSSMEEGSMMGSGYSLSNTLENIIELLIKFAVIGMLIAVIVWIFRTITKQSNSVCTDRFDWLKEDSIIRNTLIITGSVIVLMFSFSFLSGLSFRGDGEAMKSVGSSYLLPYGLSVLLVFLLKLIIIALLIVFGYGLIMYLNNSMKEKVITNETKTAKEIAKECPDCNEKVMDHWKCCPYCGSDKAFKKVEVQEAEDII